MSCYEEPIVREQCGGVIDMKRRKQFLSGWKTAIGRRAGNWQIIREKERQSTYRPQLDFVSGTCEYGTFLIQQTRNLKGEKGARKKLNPMIPWLGPKFCPPTYISQKRRQLTPDITPDLACLKSVTLLHPFWFEELNYCPRCNATGSDLSWNGWTTSGPRDVHGVSGEEQVLGVQMRCNKCKEARGKAGAADDDEDPSYCWGTASFQFWEKKVHWEIPIGVPHIKWRSAVTSELYDLIVELRPDTTSAGLAEHIKQLHLLEYHKRRREYLVHFEARTKQQAWPGKESKLRKFSEPHTGRHQEGYDNTSISDDLITDIYLDWVRETRQRESEESLRTKTGIALSIDATFRTASKATVVDNGQVHTRVYKGGITTVLNEETIILAWRFCFTQGNWELVELLQGVKRRLELLSVSNPEMVISDCCCHVANAIHDVFPDAVVCLDVWHFLMRYLICLVGGSKSPVRSEVARNIVDAILKCRAVENSLAVYWSKDEQESRLVAAFKKWDEKGVWTAAGAKAHEEQLTHVRKGCLARPRDDVRADGSRIEGTHKGWNALQRSFSSGIEMMAALGHDYVLRHNTRVESALKKPPKFTHSTFGSHHVHLVTDCARRWNEQLKQKANIDSDMEPLPVLEAPRSGETFGMLKMSPETAAHQSLASIKKEPVDNDQGLLDLSSQDLLDASRILSEVGIDPNLLYQLPRLPINTASVATQSAPLASRSMTPHPCTATHDALGSGSSPPSPSPSSPLFSNVNGATSPPAVSPPLPDDALHASAQLSSSAWMSPNISSPAVVPAASSPPLSPSGRPPSEIVDVDAFYDPNSREQKAGIIDASENNGGGVGRKGKGVDRTGKGVDRSATSPSQATRKRCADESGDTPGPAGDVIELSSDDDSAAPSQPKPPPRKKQRLTVPGIPAVVRVKKPAARSGSTSHATPTLGDFFQLQSQLNAVGHAIDTAHFPSRAISGLTRSQRIFSVASGGIDPRSLSLASIDLDEFKLFLRLRKEGKWATSTMTPFDWVCAASAYNKELEKLNLETHIERALKTPRALMDKLFELEPKLIARIISDNYQSRSGHPFWHAHCHAFPLQVGGKSGAELTAKLVNGKKAATKVHTCHRCQRVMYPGPANSPLNHPRGTCSDGVWQTARAEKTKGAGKVIPALEHPPSFPQPEKLFTADKDGYYFHADRLVKELRGFYQRIMAGDAGTGPHALYDIAFAQLLQDRVKVLDATPTSPMIALFRPFRNVKSVGVGDEQTYTFCGEDWIRIDYLTIDLPPQTGLAPSQPGPSQPAQPEPLHAGPSDSSVQRGDSPEPPPLGTSRAGGTPQPGLSRAGSSQPGTSRVGSSGTSRLGSSQPDTSRAGSSQPGPSRGGSL